MRRVPTMSHAARADQLGLIISSLTIARTTQSVSLFSHDRACLPAENRQLPNPPANGCPLLLHHTLPRRHPPHLHYHPQRTVPPHHRHCSMAEETRSRLQARRQATTSLLRSSRSCIVLLQLLRTRSSRRMRRWRPTELRSRAARSLSRERKGRPSYRLSVAMHVVKKIPRRKSGSPRSKITNGQLLFVVSCIRQHFPLQTR